MQAIKDILDTIHIYNVKCMQHVILNLKGG